MPSPKPTRSTLQDGLKKLGLTRDIDLALHLPLRYDDETQLTALGAAADGAQVQFEATVTDCEVQFKPRRQLVVMVDDGSDTCRLRFFTFFPSHHKALAVGNRVRLMGEVKRSFFGNDMVHPTIKPVGAPLPTTFTPVYPTVAGLGQGLLRKAVLAALGRAQAAGELAETLPTPFSGEIAGVSMYSLHSSLLFLHQPAVGTALFELEQRSHPALSPERNRCTVLTARRTASRCSSVAPFSAAS